MIENREHILISLEARHAENIIAGRKMVELRRRMMHITPGATVWIYAKLPVACIVGRATVAAVHTRPPSTLWRMFSSVSGVSRAEFFDYFRGTRQGTALELCNCIRLDSSFTLEFLRQVSARFNPPQFFTRLKQDTPLLDAILSPI
jgi:predicted transcriptional regulator